MIKQTLYVLSLLMFSLSVNSGIAQAMTSSECVLQVDHQISRSLSTMIGGAMSSNDIKRTILTEEATCYPKEMDTLEACNARIDNRNWSAFIGGVAFWESFKTELKTNCQNKFATNSYSLNFTQTDYDEAYLKVFEDYIDTSVKSIETYFNTQLALIEDTGSKFGQIPHNLNSSEIEQAAKDWTDAVDTMHDSYFTSINETKTSWKNQYDQLSQQGIDDNGYYQISLDYVNQLSALIERQTIVTKDLIQNYKQEFLLDISQQTPLISQPVTTVVPATKPVTISPFTDLSQNTPYLSSITFLKTKGIISGFPDGSFKPNQNLNRAEFAKILVGAKYSSISDDFNQSCFKDISKDQWYTKSVCLAKSKGIIDGYPDGTFKPGSNVNYVEALKMVLGTYELAPVVISSPWYQAYVDQADAYLFSLSSLSPDHLLTRAEISEILTRVIRYSENR